MDETMRMMIAYGELVLGFPLLAAKIIWFVPGVILAKVFDRIARRSDHIVDGAIEGFIAIIMTCLVFDHFNIQLAWAVPLILIVVNSLWNWSRGEAFRAGSSIVGILGGFSLYPLVLQSIMR